MDLTSKMEKSHRLEKTSKIGRIPANKEAVFVLSKIGKIPANEQPVFVILKHHL